MQQQGHWQPQRPSKQSWKALQQANSVYNLPSTKQAIKWMHAACGYPVKSTWLKAIKAGNYVGWPMLTERNDQKYYPRTTETGEVHLNQQRKNVQSAKLKATPLESCNTSHLHGKKVHDVYTQIYMVSKPCSPTKQANSSSNLFVAINTLWLWWKLTGTPSSLIP
jgi:hypothetical protein